jgi:hypothetical protein
LRAHDHAVHDIRLDGQLAGVVVEQKEIEAEYRLRADQSDEAAERAAALDQLLLVKASRRLQIVDRVCGGGRRQDDQHGEREFRAQAKPNYVSQVPRSAGEILRFVVVERRCAARASPCRGRQSAPRSLVYRKG